MNVAAADIDGSGRVRIVTIPGRPLAPVVRIWGGGLYRPNGSALPTSPRLCVPTLDDEFQAGAANDRRGLDVTTTNLNAVAGGFPRIVTAPATNAREVSV